jgi:hypothetical protein
MSAVATDMIDFITAIERETPKGYTPATMKACVGISSRYAPYSTIQLLHIS